MWEIIQWVGIFGGFFVLRGIVATMFFYYLLPEGDRCPNCNAVTLRLQSRVWAIMMPRCRSSWCLECGWHGLLRIGPLTPVSSVTELTRHR